MDKLRGRATISHTSQVEKRYSITYRLAQLAELAAESPAAPVIALTTLKGS